MSKELWKFTSKEYSDILESGEFYDTEILIGEEPDVKVFRLHSFVLKVRSPYFRTALSNNWVKMENNIIKFQKSNISVEIFDILIKYIYSGIIDLTEYDIRINVALLIAADELCLNDLCAYIEDYLLKDKRSLKYNFVLIQETVKLFNHFKKLLRFYNITYQQDPSLIFKAIDFTTIKQGILFDILIENNHSLKPIEIWDKIMEWCIAQSDKLPSDITKWTAYDVTTFGILIRPFIPYVNFEGIRSYDFFQKIKPFKNIFDDEFYIKILEYYSFNSDCSFNRFYSGLINRIDSKIIDLKSALFISNWVKLIKKHHCENIEYEFNLIVRGSRDGFHANTFHKLCDDKGPTITIARVKNTNEILGGFNPLSWKSDISVSVTRESFIFSLNKMCLERSIFSRVEDENNAIANAGCWGPNFGGDFELYSNKMNKVGTCSKIAYEKLIRKQPGSFGIEEYEVFQLSGKINNIPVNF